MIDLIERQAALDVLLQCRKHCIDPFDSYHIDIEDAEARIRRVPAAQPEPLSDAYTKAVWTWLLDYQIKAAELQGRYTPYEVLSWVVNDWRKDHEQRD